MINPRPNLRPRLATAFCAAALLAGVATAQPVPAPAVGDAVSGTGGAPIGTVSAVSGVDVIVDTGTHKVTVPAATFARNDKGLVMEATREQVDAFGQQAEAAGKAALTAALVPGAAIAGVNGKPLGTITAVNAGMVDVKTTTGAVRLPANAFMVEGGALKIGMTQAEFDAAVAAAVKPG